MTKIGTHVGIWLGNSQVNFQLHRFTTSENIATSFRESYFFDLHCKWCGCIIPTAWWL